MRIADRILSAVVVTVILAAMAVTPVFADYVDMIDYGFGYKNGSTFYWNVEAGSTITGNYPMVYWAIDSFDPDYTYTFTFRFTSTSSLNTSSNPNVYISTNRLRTIDSSMSTVPVYSVLERDENTYTCIVKLNFGLLDITSFPAYITARINHSSTITTTINGWSVSAEYDPGGNKYTEEYLNQIVNAGSGYPVPDEAASSLDSSVQSMHQAESSIFEKSDQLISSVSDTWTSNKNSVKEFTETLKPAALQMNNLFLVIHNALPNEVKILFIVIPMLLFIGWLLGRVDK